MADQLALMPKMDFTSLTASQYRSIMTAFTPPLVIDTDLASVQDIQIEGSKSILAGRLYRPTAKPSLPIIAYFHGGGFVSMGLDSHDNVCRRIARLTQAIVISVDYRLAPEHPFPAPLEDAVAAVRWMHRHAINLEGDPNRMAIAGDSAGANLATVAALILPAHGIELCHQLLFYPMTDALSTTDSMQNLKNAPLLTPEAVRWFWQQYLNGTNHTVHGHISPLRHPHLETAPPATIITAEFDPLRDEGELYAQALTAAGCPVTHKRWKGQFHGFVSFIETLDDASAALTFGAEHLQKALTQPIKQSHQ